MANINKYWILLESLHFPMIGATKYDPITEDERTRQNLKMLQDNIKLSPKDIVESINEHRGNNKCYIFEATDEYFLYSLYSVKMLLEICANTHFSSDATEDLLSERHKSLIISSIVDAATYALQENLHKTFYKEKAALFKKRDKKETDASHLEFFIEAFAPIMSIRALHVGKSLDDVQLWYMAAVFSLLMACDLNECQLEQTKIANLQNKLQKLWLELSKKVYFRNLMLLFYSLPIQQRQRIHREMLLRLWSPGGFLALLFAMADSQQRNEDQSLDETVATLVAQPSYSIKAQHSLIKQVLQFLEASLKNKEYTTLMGAGILSLKKLYDNKKENQDLIKKWLETKLEPLITVKDKTKVIAMESLDFVDMISLIFHIFCTSSIATLPSDLLIYYIPVFLELHCEVECHANQNTLVVHLSSLILKILNNRSKQELRKIIESIALIKYPQDWYQLSCYIQIKENPLNLQELKLCLVDDDKLRLVNNHSLGSLVTIIKSSSHNLLTYQHFLILLQMVPSLVLNTDTKHESNVDLLETEEDVCQRFLKNFSLVYETKIQILKALEVLVQHQPLKSLINDNIKDLLNVLQNILNAFSRSFEKESKETEDNKTVLMILLVLIREILENCSFNVKDFQVSLLKPLKQLESQIKNENLKYQLIDLLKIIKDEESLSSQQCRTFKNEFEDSRSLIQSNESYLQVQGIEMMIKLLNKRDEHTVANSHLLTALALNTLKSPESYTFLNCVRLFVALVKVKESEVLDHLSDEYLNDAAAMDYRLVIGEVILKTSKELGPLCYKYKNVLLNAFMTGCRSALNEFRFSAFSNLSQLCRQLTYQVHNYFQELLNLIDCELTTGKYLPAKRAAVMVLSELLAGMDNLFEYEEMLLPIYRLLKYLSFSDQIDEKMRTHAANGLQCLAEKCKELFRTSLEQNKKGLKLEKEIKIMGIHEKPKRNLKSHILEMN